MPSSRKPEGRVARFRTLTRDVGLAYAIQNALAAVLPREIFDINLVEIHAQKLDDARFGKSSDPGIRWLTPADLPDMQAFDPQAEDLEHRFAAGAVAACLFADGKIVGWRWFQPRIFEQHDWLRFELGNDEVWGFGALIDPKRRGEGIFGRLTGFAAADLRPKGTERILALSFVLNKSAVRAKEKTGATLRFQLFWIRLLRLTLLRVNGRYRVGLWTKANPLTLPLHNQGRLPAQSAHLDDGLRA